MQIDKKVKYGMAALITAALLVLGWPAAALALEGDEDHGEENRAAEILEGVRDAVGEAAAQTEDEPGQDTPAGNPNPVEPGSGGEGEEQEYSHWDGEVVPPPMRYTMEYDPQPVDVQDVLDILENDAMPRWQHPVEPELLPEGFVLKEVELEAYGLTYYSIEFVTREPETRQVGTPAALREAFEDLVDGDVIELTTSLEIGTLASADGSAAALSIPSGVEVTLRADENGPYRLYRRDGMRHFMLRGVEESTLVFENVTLQGLYAEGDGKMVYSGGIGLEDCREVTLQGAHILGAAAPTGGGLQINSSEEIHLQSLAITESAAQEGGAIAAFGSTLALASCTLEENNAALGGALFAEDSGLDIQGTTLQDNSAVWGGGLYLSGARATLDEETLAQGNRAYTDTLNESAQGGAARLENGATLVLQGTSLQNNTAQAEKGDSMGGAVAVCGSSALEAVGAVLEGNTATAGYGLAYGGGVYLGKNNRQSSLEETAVQNNQADVGGGVYLNQGASLALGQVAQVLLAGNRANLGGGALCAYEDAELHLGGQAALEENDAEQGEDVYLYGSATLYAEEELLAEQAHATAGQGEEAEQEEILPAGIETVPFVAQEEPGAVVFIPMDLSGAGAEAEAGWGTVDIVLFLACLFFAVVLLQLACVTARRSRKKTGEKE